MSVALREITQEDIQSFYELLDDFPAFAEEFLRIKDESGNIVPFILNELQLYVCSIALPKILSNQKIWLNILKCRQTGISTLFEAIFFWISLRELNQKMLIIAHEQPASENIYTMFERYLKNMPEPMQPSLDQSQRGKKIRYSRLGNEVEVKTAGSGVDSNKAGSGRSSTYQYIHASECAFYQDYKTTFAGLLQASKKAKLIVKETTANGYNAYRNDWVDDVAGNTDYIPIFLAWIDFKSYTKDFTSQFEKERLTSDLGANMRYNSYKGEEEELLHTHKCTLEQLNWRRWAIDNLCGADVDIFHQEYPTTWEEAFLATGRPVFNQSICNANKSNALEPIRIGDLVYTDESKKEVEFIENAKGYIKIYDDLEFTDKEHYVYVAGCDVAEGLAQGDRSIIKVMDRRTYNVSLTWSGHIDPDLLSEEQHKIQLFLKNQVHFCTEVNNHGLTTVVGGFKLGVNQYYRQDFQRGYEAQKMEIGWKTTSQSKPIMIGNLQEWIRDNLFTDNESEFWSECITFVKNERGQMQANGKDKDPSTKCYDDRVMASALMIICHLWLPNYFIDKEDPILARPGSIDANNMYDEATF